MLNIVVPMAGRGSRFTQARFTQPKPLIPIMGKPMIEWIVGNVRPRRPHRFIFVCLEEHLSNQPEVAATLRCVCPECEIRMVGAVTEGAACTVLTVKELIDTDTPLMIANSDQFVALGIDDYLAFGDAGNLDGLIMTFWADDPKWSYCRMRPDGTVLEVVEKQVVSNEATVGIYNFKRGSDFVRAAERMIARDLRVNNEFYVAPVYNQLIEEGAQIGVMRTGREYEGMHGLGTPADLAHFMTTTVFQRALAGEHARLRSLTIAYADAFNRRELAAMSAMFIPNVTLEDSDGLFAGREAAVTHIEGMFSSSPEFGFHVTRVHVCSSSTTVIECLLSLGDTVYIGAKLCEWQGDKLSAIRAYLRVLPTGM